MDFKHLFVCVAGCLAVTSYGKGGDAGKPKDWPVFSSVVYEGNDAVFTKNPLRKDEFYNPIPIPPFVVGGTITIWCAPPSRCFRACQFSIPPIW